MDKIRLLARAFVALTGLVMTPSAEAEGRQTCAARDTVVQKLHDRFGEELRSLGLHQSDGIVEVYSSESTGTWTILMTRPDGMSCLIAAGQLWEQDAKPLEKPGKPA